MSEPTTEQLQALQQVHLQVLESRYNNVLVAGVPVVRVINYKTIQVVNQIGLQALLRKEHEGTTDA